MSGLIRLYMVVWLKDIDLEQVWICIKCWDIAQTDDLNILKEGVKWSTRL